MTTASRSHLMRMTLTAGVLLLVLSIFLGAADTARAETLALRFVEYVPSSVSTLSQFTISAEVYDVATNQRFIDGSLGVVLDLYRMVGGVPTPIGVPVAGDFTVNGLVELVTPPIDVTGANYFYVLRTSVFADVPGPLFTVETTYLTFETAVPSDLSTAASFSVSIAARLGDPSQPPDLNVDFPQVRLELHQLVGSEFVVVDPNLTSGFIQDGLAAFPAIALPRAGTAYFLIARALRNAGDTPAPGVISASVGPFTVIQAGLRFEPQPTSVTLGSPITQRVVVTRGSAANAPIETRATNYPIQLSLLQLIGGTPTMIVANFASGVTTAGIVDLGPVSIGTTGTDFYFNAAPMAGAPPDAITPRTSVFFNVVSPATASLSFTLQGRPAAPSPLLAVPITVTLTPTSGGQTLVVPVTASNQGQVTISGLLPGSYRIGLKYARSLRVTLGTVTLAAGINTFVAGPLPAGDANNDNVVTIADFSVLASSFGLSAGSAGYLAGADFTGDEVVNIADFSLLASRFGQPGAAP